MNFIPGKLYRTKRNNQMAVDPAYRWKMGDILMFIGVTDSKRGKNSTHIYSLDFLLPSGGKIGYVSSKRDRLVQNGTDLSEDLFEDEVALPD